MHDNLGKGAAEDVMLALSRIANFSIMRDA